MFGRRRHIASAVAPSPTAFTAAVATPCLSEEQIFELVHSRIAAAIGENGNWVVRRRSDDDTDDLFRSVLAHQVSVEVTAAVRDAQRRLEAGEPVLVGIPAAATRTPAAESQRVGEATDQPSEVPSPTTGADVADSQPNAQGAVSADAESVAPLDVFPEPTSYVTDDQPLTKRPAVGSVVRQPTEPPTTTGSLRLPWRLPGRTQAKALATVDPDERLVSASELTELLGDARSAPRTVEAADHNPSHRHDDTVTHAHAVLDEESIALQWEPAPITVWTDLKRPVAGPVLVQREDSDAVA